MLKKYQTAKTNQTLFSEGSGYPQGESQRYTFQICRDTFLYIFRLTFEFPYSLAEGDTVRQVYINHAGPCSGFLVLTALGGKPECGRMFRNALLLRRRLCCACPYCLFCPCKRITRVITQKEVCHTYP